MRSDAGRPWDKRRDAKACQCPFCDSPMEEAFPFCKACGRTLRRCPKCGQALEVNEVKCPKCK